MRVLVPVDDMPYSYAALESLLQRVWPEDVSFTICRVIESNESHVKPSYVYNPLDHYDHLSAEKQQHVKRVEKWLDGIRDALSREFKKVETQILVGEIDDALVNCAGSLKADFIIMGSHDRNLQERIWLGSVAAKVAQAADCSVELVRPGMLNRILHEKEFDINKISQIDFVPKRIVVPLDFSSNSVAALRWLSRVGGLRKANFALISVARPKSSGVITGLIGHSDDYAQPADSDLHIQLDQVGDLLLAKNREIQTVDTFVLKGEPVASIIEFADQWRADTIVAATCGATNKNHPIVGSVARGIMDAAHCTVVAVKPNISEDFTFSWKSKQSISVR